MKYYKLLFGDVAIMSDYKWDLSGEWMEVKGLLRFCENGFHVITAKYIPEWLWCGLDLYEVEIGKEKINADDKICARRARIIRKIGAYNRTAVREVVNRAVKRVHEYFARDRRHITAKYAEEALYFSRYMAVVTTNRVFVDSAWDATQAAYSGAFYANSEKSERSQQVKDIIELAGLEE